MKILIIDESLFSRTIIQQALIPLDIQCLHASDGKTAWKILHENEDIRLVTLSMVLEDTSGLEFLIRCQNLKNIGKLDFVLITSTNDETTRAQAFEYGTANFLSKPFKPETLVNICKRLLFKDNLFYGCHILIVDDSRTTRELIKKALSFLGIKIAEASSGAEALELLRNGPKIDLVITDMMMPEMNGTELTWEIRQLENYHSVPIIMLSGDTKMENILNYFKAGISDYLCKPFVSEELIARVRVHLSLYLQSQEAQETMLELEELSRMKDEVLAVCSHDIRSPLNAILGNTELLLDEAVPGIKDYATDIKDSATTLLELVNDLLDAGKKQATEASQKSELDLQKVIMKAIRQQNSRIINKSLNLQSSLNPTLIFGEESSLKRIFANLLSNAIKFTPSDGTITLSCEEINDQAVVIVKDSGIGIPAEMVPKLFDKNTPASRAGTDGEESTGLGMSIVKELVHHHDGNIEVQSVENSGTAFIITFPLVQSKTAKVKKDSKIEKTIKPDKPVITKTISPQQANILIVDDNSANLRLLEKMLKKNGFENITKAENGVEAMDLYCAFYEDTGFDLVITDIEMPEKNGDEVADEIRKLPNSVKKPFIVALSGHRGAEYPEGLFDAALTKPILVNQLKSTLRQFTGTDL
ncbi:MAG: response regulator [Lentisphaerales bacterium]|nr:response regulator [Lentisphaerales bacterium]